MVTILIFFPKKLCKLHGLTSSSNDGEDLSKYNYNTIHK